MTTPVDQTSDAPLGPRPAGRVLAERYRLGRRIGAGGMATILRGRDLHMERDIAVKVLHRHLADDPEVRRRFAAEAQHAAALNHPHVVAVYDQGEADLPWIVLELVDGPSLREVLATHGPLSPPQLLAVLEPLCRAVDAAHRIGLIHRDIKPENVLVTPDGHPKLADFGIARVMAATSHTATGTLVGSVHYLAPELVDGVEATPASDQYALAVMGFELLTGRKPLPAETPMAIALRHANEDVPPPSRYAPEVPPALDRVIARATDRDPTARYPDLQAMAAALRAAVDAPAAPVTAVTDDGVRHTLVMPTELAETSTLPVRTATPDRRARSAADPSTAAHDLARRRADRVAAPRVRRWPRRVGIGVVVLAVLGLLGLGGWLAYPLLIPTVELGDLTGLTQAEAFAAAEADGLAIDIDAEQHRLDVPAGVVIGQDPPSGTELRRGDVVRVVLSLGPRVVEMPDLLTRDYESVTDLLEADHFDVTLGYEHHDTVPEGGVIGQLPDPGTPVEQGSAVALTLSLGIEQVTVPDLAGMTLAEAEAALEEVRLQAEVTEEWSDEDPEPGTVIAQGTAAGEEVDALTTVPVVVSRGPLTVEVPDLLGMDVAAARQAVAGLEEIVLDEQTGPVPTLGPFTLGSVDRVERQSPEPGAAIQRGQTITIYYFVEG